MRYQIQGDPLPVVICQLEAGERMITEGGGMSWMSPNMKMETTTNGGIGKAVGRMFSGEKMFQNVYTAEGGNGMIAFASSFPGSIRAFEITPGQDMVFQKSAFLAGEAGVNLSIFFNKRFKVIRNNIIIQIITLNKTSCMHNFRIHSVTIAINILIII